MTSSNGSLLSDLMPMVRQQLMIDEKKRRYVHDPAAWAWDILGVHLWAKQVEIANAIRTNRRVAVAAGHGVGKSFVAGVICMWWWDTHPLIEDETFVATTAPSKDQVDLIWAVIRTMHSRMNLRFEQKLIDHGMPGYITGDNKFKLKDGQTLGQGRKPPDSRSDIAFQGRHATYLLAIGDEAVGLTEGFLNALEVIAVGAHNHILLLANPTDPSSAMARLWPDPEGRMSEQASKWTRIHIGVPDTPLNTQEKGWEQYKETGMSGPDFLADAVGRYGGKDDPRYIARVLGQWAWDSGLGLFPEEVIARSMRTEVRPSITNPKHRFGVDVARMGVDSTQVYECMEGVVWQQTYDEDGEESDMIPTDEVGLYIRKVAEWRKAKVTSSDPTDLGSAQRLDALALEYGVQAVNIDAGGGLGAGLFDAIMDLWDRDPRGQNYAMFEVYGNDMKMVDRRSFINLRAMMFSELKRRMAAGEIDLDSADDELMNELRGIRAKVVNGSVLQIESKESMKDRGAKSPDRADAVWYATLDTVGEANGIAPGEQRQIDPMGMIPDAPAFYQGSPFGW